MRDVLLSISCHRRWTTRMNRHHLSPLCRCRPYRLAIPSASPLLPPLPLHCPATRDQRQKGSCHQSFWLSLGFCNVEKPPASQLLPIRKICLSTRYTIHPAGPRGGRISAGCAIRKWSLLVLISYHFPKQSPIERSAGPSAHCSNAVGGVCTRP